MTAALEYNHAPATFSKIENERGIVFCNGVFVPRGETVKVCSWCDTDKKLTVATTAADYKISHGLCLGCSEKFNPKKGAAHA